MILAQVPSYVPTSGLVAYYPFTGNANDTTSNANNGVVYDVTLTADKNGNSNSAYLFNGTSNNIGLSQPFLGRAQVNLFTFFTRFKTIGSPPNTNNGCYNLWGKSFLWGEINFGIAADNTIYIIWFNTNGGNNATHIQTNSSITQNTWNDLVITFDNSQVNMYLNRVLLVATNVSEPNSLANFAQEVNSSKIGSRIIVGQTVGFFNGIIDNLGVWNRALAQNEINNLSYTDVTCGTLVINREVLV